MFGLESSESVVVLLWFGLDLSESRDNETLLYDRTEEKWKSREYLFCQRENQQKQSTSVREAQDATPRLPTDLGQARITLPIFVTLHPRLRPTGLPTECVKMNETVGCEADQRGMTDGARHASEAKGWLLEDRTAAVPLACAPEWTELFAFRRVGRPHADENDIVPVAEVGRATCKARMMRCSQLPTMFLNLAGVQGP